nr:histidine kinase [Cytophagales bacterium]
MKTKRLPFQQIERWSMTFIFLAIILTNVLKINTTYSDRGLENYFAKIFIPLILFLAYYSVHYKILPFYFTEGKKVKPILLTILVGGMSLGLIAAISYGADISENIFLPLYFGAVATYIGYLVVTYMLDQILLPPNLKDYTVYNAVRIGMIYLFIPIFLFQGHFFISPVISVLFVIILPALAVILVYSYFLIYKKKRSGNTKSSRFFYRLLMVAIIAFSAFMVLVNNGHPVFFTIGIIFALLTAFIVIPFFELLFTKYESYLGELNSLTVRVDEGSARLTFLRSQINPHFLFNILNTLYGAALQENAEKTASGIQKLGDMMRFMLHENTREKIPVEHEKDYLINYVDLQELRIKDQENITVTFNRSEPPCSGEIAPMLLIPFIENAFKHGISLQKKSWVTINLRCIAGSVHLDVTNSIYRTNPDDPEHQSSGIGLENVKQRLKLLYPGKHDLMIRENDTEYFVHLSIQL